jgi:isoleucyl-tRNA synthetase
VALDAPDGIVVEHAAGEKCERCWKYSEAVGRDADFPTVCEYCAPVLKEMLG